MKWSWSGAVTLSLALAVAISLTIATWQISRDVTEGQILATIMGAIVGAISTYLGTTKRGGD